MGTRKKLQQKDRISSEATDRISTLPDHIIFLILSLLTPRDAVTTGVLSSRWRYLWKYSTDLDFSSYSMFKVNPTYNLRKLSLESREAYMKERTCKFIDLVNSFLDILKSHHPTVIETFKVSFCLHQGQACHLDRWISIAISLGMKELDLDLLEILEQRFIDVELYEFPFHLFVGGQGSILSSLRLRWCTFRPPATFDGLRSLKELHLMDVLTEVDLQNLLTGCHSLERMTLHKCSQLVEVRIFDPFCPLKYLSIQYCDNLESVECHSINLMIFEYFGRRIRFNFKTTPQLKRVFFNLLEGSSSYVDYALNKLPGVLPHIKDLLLTFISPFQVAILPDSPHKFMQLKRLSVDLSTSSKVDILWFASLLNAAPLMERFQLQVSYSPDSDEKQRKITKDIFRKKKRCKKQRNIARKLPKCPHCHLRIVEIRGYSSAVIHTELAKYILENAPFLESMVVDPRIMFYGLDQKWHREYFPWDFSVERKKAYRHLAPLSPKIVIL